MTALLLIVALFGVPGLLTAQNIDQESEPPIDETVSFAEGPRIEVDEGERFELTLTIPRDDPEAVRLGFPPLPEGVRQPEGPVVVTRGQQDMEVRIPLVANEPGRFVLDAIQVTSPSAVRETEPVLVEVRDRQRGVIPFQARWRVAEEDVRQGQSIPVFLEIVGIDTFAFPEIVNLRSPEAGLFEEVSGIGSVTSEDIANTTLYQIPVAAFIFTSTSAGTSTIPAATIRAEGIDVTAPALEIDVNSLPQQVESSGAVGELSVDVSVDSSTLMPGDTGEVTVRVSGTGNLPVLDFPEVELQGLVEVGRSQDSSVVPDQEDLRGYQGSRELAVRFEAEGNAAAGSVVVNSFPVFDPNDGVVRTIPGRSIPIEIIPSDAEAPLDEVAPEADLISLPDLTNITWIPFSEIPWIYSLFIAGPAIFGIVRLWSVRGRTTLVALPLFIGAALFPRLDMDRLTRADELIADGRPAVAAVLYELEVQENEWHAGLHFNRGVLALRVNDPIDAMYHLRRAVRLAPERSRFRAVLSDAEEYFDMDTQSTIPWYVRPDSMVAALWVVWTLFWLLLAVRGRLRRTIALVTLVMVGVVLIGGWWWSVRQAGESEAVVVRP
ncbi:MAG: tetratricopeptide repeat protein, partial [Alkalispirochaeta sp.]